MTDQYYIGKPVKSLQNMLRTIAQAENSQPTVVPDGVYGEQTVRAVSEFQRQHGIETTGITDFDTWQAIRDAYTDAIIEVDAAAPLEIILDRQQVFLPGSKNRHIFLVQAMLMALAIEYKEFSDVHANGIYDEATQRAIRWLQGVSGIKRSGVFTKATWKLLTGLYLLKVRNGETEKDLQPL